MSPIKTNSENSVTKAFGNKVRIRVCGLLFRGDDLLLIKHNMGNYHLWAPPGGGVEFGESLNDTLVREFREETGITVVVGDFLFLHEHIAPPLHAVELFYQVSTNDFKLTAGREPELGEVNIFEEIAFINATHLRDIPAGERHAILKSCINPIELLDKRGEIK